jgi:hypothetical protein
MKSQPGGQRKPRATFPRFLQRSHAMSCPM